MEAVVSNINELANALGWHDYGWYEWHINLKNDSGQIVSIFWNKKTNQDNPKFTVTATLNKRQYSWRNCNTSEIEKILTDPQNITKKKYQ